MPTRSPDRLDAWILGSGIASLTAAVHLVQEAHVPPSRIHIVSKSSISSRTTVSYGDAEHGYDFRAGMRPQLNDMCMDTLLSLVPSIPDKVPHGQTHGVGRLEGTKASLGMRDRIAMFKLATKSEKAIGRSRICDFFRDSFFQSEYWLSLATTFGLKPYHSAAEFRRYLHRFSDLHDLNDPHVLDLGKYNFHESIIVPITRFLHSQGVDFRYNTTISDILFAYDNPDNPTDPTRVAAIRTYPTHERYMPMSSKEEIMIELSPDDIVFSLFGSVFSAILTGDNTRSPPFLEHVKDNLDFDFAAPVDHFGSELDESWLLWLELCTKHPKFGNAYNFCTRLHESRLEFFTITLSSPEFFNRLAGTTCDEPGPNTILTLRDSSWLITLRIPHQPVFPNQPPSVQVCLGYALFPEKEGDYIGKPMLKCSGQEILTEVLQHLRYPLESILKNAIAIPHIQPRAAATFLPRNTEDRPRVIPPGMSNMAIIGPFVEIDDEVVVTTDYSVRGAQIAVRELMGVSRPVKKSKRASCIEILGML